MIMVLMLYKDVCGGKKCGSTILSSSEMVTENLLVVDGC